MLVLLVSIGFFIEWGGRDERWKTRVVEFGANTPLISICSSSSELLSQLHLPKPLNTDFSSTAKVVVLFWHCRSLVCIVRNESPLQVWDFDFVHTPHRLPFFYALNMYTKLLVTISRWRNIMVVFYLAYWYNASDLFAHVSNFEGIRLAMV